MYGLLLDWKVIPIYDVVDHRSLGSLDQFRILLYAGSLDMLWVSVDTVLQSSVHLACSYHIRRLLSSMAGSPGPEGIFIIMSRPSSKPDRWNSD